MAKKSTQTNKKSGQETGMFDSPEKWLPWVLAILGFVLYCTGFGNKMLGIDDHSATVDNPAVRDFLLFNGFNLGMFAPVTWIGYEIAYTFGKESPNIYHFLSAMVHAVNIALVFRLFRRIDSNVTVTALVTLLFAIHPIQVESVAWIAGFSTPLFSMFYLLSCLWYLDYAESGSGKKYGYALGAFLLACLSKSAAVTLPLTLVLLDWWFGRSVTDTNRLLRYAPFALLSIVFGGLTIYSRQSSGMAMPDVVPLSAAERVLALCYTPVFYWAKLLMPVKLNVYYSFESIRTSFVWAYWASIPVLALVFWGAWAMRNSARFLLFGLLFFFAQICIMLPFHPMGTFELCADHYNYLASLGVFLMLVRGFQYMMDKRPSIAWLLRSVGVLWIAALLVMTTLQIRVWKDTITVVTNAINNGFHQNGRLYQARATAYASDNRDLKSALKDYSQALQINPMLWDSYKFRGNLYGVQKMYENSIEDLTKYIEQNPNSAPELYNRGLSYANLERNREAVADFTRAIESDPTFARAYRARGNCLKKMGEEAKGEEDLKKYESMDQK